jgi:hypothetical protein
MVSIPRRCSEASHASRTCFRLPSNDIWPSLMTMPHLVAMVNFSRCPLMALPAMYQYGVKRLA